MTDEVENGAEAAVSTDSPDIENDAPAGETSLDEALSQTWDRHQQTDRRRDAAGRFAADDGDDTPGEGGANADDAGVAEALKAPSSWRKAAQLMWDDIDPRLQEEIWKREKDTQSAADRARHEAMETLRKFDGVDGVLDANRDLFEGRGISARDGLSTLISAQRMLDDDPVQGIVRIAESYGIDLPELFAGYDMEDGYEPDPEIAALQDEVAELRQYHAEQAMAQEAYMTDEIAGEMEAFAADHQYFERVRDEMSRLVSIGAADTFDEAYRMAVASDPDIREEEAEAADIAKERASHDRTLRARRAAAVNVRSSPVTGRGKQSMDDTLNDLGNRLFS